MDYSPDCIFCRIASHKMGELEYETDNIVVFRDIQPKAKIHLLIVPKKHIAGLDEIGESGQPLLGEFLSTAKLMADKFKLSNGYRIVVNTGPDGGQTVPHLHLHLLGGEKLKADP